MIEILYEQKRVFTKTGQYGYFNQVKGNNFLLNSYDSLRDQFKIGLQWSLTRYTWTCLTYTSSSDGLWSRTGRSSKGSSSNTSRLIMFQTWTFCRCLVGTPMPVVPMR